MERIFPLQFQWNHRAGTPERIEAGSDQGGVTFQKMRTERLKMIRISTFLKGKGFAPRVPASLQPCCRNNAKYTKN